MTSTISALTTGGGGIVMSGDSSGNLSLLSGATTVVAVTSTGASVTGTLAATGSITGSSTVAGSTGILYPLTSGTAVASTSGTSIDFTGIPSWVKRITVMFSGVSTSGISNPQIQVGSGSVSTTGYVSFSGYSGATTSTLTITTGLLWDSGGSGTELRQGVMTINLLGSNTWVSGVTGGFSQGASIFMYSGGGTTPALAGALDRVRITTVNGTDTFDAGSVNILYE